MLYAPTFRGQRVTDARSPTDLDLALLRDRLGDDHVVLVRSHPLVRADARPGATLGAFAIDVSDHPDVNELLLVSDVLVTDYSSIIFEFALLDRPMLFFAPDLDAYERERGFYADYRTWVPGPVLETTEAVAARSAPIVRPRARAGVQGRLVRGRGRARDGAIRRPDRPTGAPLRVRYDTRPVPLRLTPDGSTSTSGVPSRAMTFRAKPVAKRSHRPSWESQDRRNFYLNLGFGLVVLAAIVILAIAAGVTWYSKHLAPAATVDGQTITIDEFNDRFDLERWRIQEAKRRVTNQFQSGRLTQAQADNNQAFLDQQLQALPNTALERLIDTRIQATLATQEGVEATAADIDARLVTEATIPETRHAWIIEVEPVVDAGALEPTAEQVTAAKAKADAALADLQAGKAWDEVAKTVSTDASTAPAGWRPGLDHQGRHAVRRGLRQGRIRRERRPAVGGHRG